MGGEVSFSPCLAPAGALAAESCWPGVARRQVTFFCFAKRKSPKKRRPAVWVPSLRFGQPAVLEASGVSLELATLRFAQTIASPDPLASALLGPARTGQSEAGTKYQRNQYRYKQGRAKACLCGLLYLGFCLRLLAVRYSFSHPFCLRRGAEVQADQGSRLSERSAGDADSRVAFLLLTFLWRSKEK